MKSTQPLQPASLTEAAYLRLRNDLLSCRIRPGERLKIAEIAETFAVNLGAVREALSRLTAEGLVTAESQRGYTAAPVSLSDLHQLTAARIEIETLCVRGAIAAGDLEWETNIVASFHRLVRTPEYESGGEGDVISERWAELHSEFHAALAAGCGNSWFLRLRKLLYDQSERYRRLSIPFRITDKTLRHSQSTDQERDHRCLMEAVIARDVDQTVMLLASHLQRTATLIEVFTSDEDRQRNAIAAQRQPDSGRQDQVA